MSVTFKKREEDPLALYVDFLNIDLSTDPRPKLKKGQRLKDFLDQFEREPVSCKINPITGKVTPKPSNPNWLEEARSLQIEMKDDLYPIAARREIPEKLFPVLERWVYLTEKLNEMNFIRRWDPHLDRKGQIRIRGWNFKLGYDQRDIWYLGLAERLENGHLERLRLCPICRKFFSARDKRQMFCGTKCKMVHDNQDAKFRVRRYRAKQKRNSKKQDKIIRDEKILKRFFNLIEYATCNSQDTNTAGKIALRLGQGDAIKGWRLIDRLWDQLKVGVDPRKVFDGLPKDCKSYFYE